MNITVTQLDDEPMDDMKLNLSESVPSEFHSMSSQVSRSSSSGRADEYGQERSPHSMNSEGMSHLSVNNLRLNKNGSIMGQPGNAYCTPEGKNEEVCDSARNRPKFMQFGVQAPRKGGAYISDTDSCSSNSARKQRRPSSRTPLNMSGGKVKEFRLDASDVDSSSDSGNEQTQIASSHFGTMGNNINMVRIGNTLGSSTAMRV